MKITDIIECIIYDVKEARSKYQRAKNEAKPHPLTDTCIQECDEELEFLENLKKEYKPKKYIYASRSVLCKTDEDVDRVLNEEVYKMNKPEDVISLQIVPYINPEMTDGFAIPACWYVCYVYRWEE